MQVVCMLVLDMASNHEAFDRLPIPFSSLRDLVIKSFDFWDRVDDMIWCLDKTPFTSEGFRLIRWDRVESALTDIKTM
jgi:hypothetical protein